MKTNKRFVPPVLGGSSLLIVFAVLCLVVFALLGLSTGRANRQLSDTSAEAVEAYYSADRMAEEVYAQLRRGEMPRGVTEKDGIYSYQCRISDTQVLHVALKREGDSWTVLLWQAMSVTQWEADEAINLWDGTPES